MNAISLVLKKIDYFCDYVPVISTGTNLIDLFFKYVVLPSVSEKTIESNHYFKHIKNKEVSRCLLLLIPIYGNIKIGVYDFKEKSKDDISKKKNDNDIPEKNYDPESLLLFKNESLENINNLDEDEMNKLCSNIKVSNRVEYIKCLLIHAIKAEKFCKKNVEKLFTDDIFHSYIGIPKIKEFVPEDINAGRKNQDDTLLHEILKCKLISPETKASVFIFALRDGHEYLRGYMGDKKDYYSPIPWGDSLKKVFDNFSSQDKNEFFQAFSDHKEAEERLKKFTGIRNEDVDS